MFQRMGMDTGVDLDKLLPCTAGLPELVGHDVPGAVVKLGNRTVVSESEVDAGGSCSVNPIAYATVA